MELQIITICLFILYQTAGATADLVNNCCNIGRSWYSTSRHVCPTYGSMLSVPDQDKNTCRSVIDICCLLEKKERQCVSGAQVAKRRNSCESLNFLVGKEEDRECCNCCLLGTNTAWSGLPCIFGPSIKDARCEKYFMLCCNSASPQPSTQVPIKIEGICERFSGQLCAQVCISTPGSYKCACTEGFELLGDSKTCRKISSCVTNNPCQHQCIDEPNSTRCACRVGYELDSDMKSCRDVNECLQQTECKDYEICENTPGSFMCKNNFQNITSSPSVNITLCGTGYFFNKQTQQCEDINECAIGRDSCMEGQTCENTIGSYQCRRSMSCGTGYTLDLHTQNCLDDNECTLGTHNCGPMWECMNMPGSFRCVIKKCSFGYKLNLKSGSCDLIVCATGMKPDAFGNCADIDECVENPNACRQNQECKNTIGSYTCRDIVTCGAGYVLNEVINVCEDINECDTAYHKCSGQLMQCINQPGSYMCQCPPGFQLDHNLRACEDIDECRMSSHVCAQNARCENTHGSYRCQCREGFEMVGSMCLDIDECSRPGMCHHTCRNTWGSFHCTCKEGYKIASDRRMCEDIDECAQAAESNIHLCYGICENTPGSFICTCPSGYQLSANGRLCEDVDECLFNTAQCNDPDEMCINIKGSYKCGRTSCPKGFTKHLYPAQKSVKCQRSSLICPQGDVECLYSPLSLSINYITFPSQIRIPADLFNLKGPVTPRRRFQFLLNLIKAADPITGESRVNRNFFNVKVKEYEAVIQLLHKIEGPQDIELELKMTIFSREYQDTDEVLMGEAVARIFIYVTKEQW